jgi:hypothetical protein
MTDESGSPPGQPGGRRKRPPTVLNLEATDVTPAEQPAAAADAPDAAAGQPAEQAASEPSRPEPSAAETTQPRSPEPSAARRSRGLPEGVLWTHVGAGIAGAVGGLGVVLLLWFGGALSGIRDASSDLGPQLNAVQHQLAAAQQQIKEISARPAPAATPSIDPKAMDALAARLAKLEAAPAAPRGPVTDPAIAGRLSAVETNMKALAESVDAVAHRANGQDGAMREANARLEKLGEAIGDLQAALRASQAGSDRAARLAMVALELRDAVERGEPFTAELAIVKPLAPDSPEIATLEPFAASGVPNDAALGRELTALIQSMMQTTAPRAPSPAAGGAGFLDRLQTSAEKLVRVTPVDEARGDDRGATLSRLDRRAEKGDVTGAISEISKLPADARASFQAWIDKAQARQKAIAAGRRLATNAVTALKPVP